MALSRASSPQTSIRNALSEAEWRTVIKSLPVPAAFVRQLAGCPIFANSAFVTLVHETASKKSRTIKVHPDDVSSLEDVANKTVPPMSIRFGKPNSWHAIPVTCSAIEVLESAKPTFLLVAIPGQTNTDSRPTASVNHDHQRLLELLERERAEIACEIHDGVIQDAIGIRMTLDSLLERLASTDPEVVPQFLRMRAAVRRSIDESRRLVSGLRSLDFVGVTLVQALETLVDDMEKFHDLRVKYEYSNSDIHLSESVIRSIYRIIQESLNNVKRHARVQSASLSVSLDASDVVIELTDSGVGFDVSEPRHGHFGISGMHDRARWMNAELTIHSQPNVGTTVRLRVPQLSNEASATPAD